MKRLSTLFCSLRATSSLILLLIGLLLGATPLQAKISIFVESVHTRPRHYYYADGVYYLFVEDMLLSSYNPTKDHCMRTHPFLREYVTGSCREMNKIFLDHLSTHYKLYQEDKTIPVAQRREVTKLLEKNRELAAISLKAVSVGKNNYLGYPVEVYEVRYQGKAVEEIWISPALRKELLQVFDLDTFQKEARNELAKQLEAFPLTPTDPFQRVIRELEQKGVVLKRAVPKNLSYEEIDSNYQLIADFISYYHDVTEIEKKPTPNPDALKPPADYKEAESMELFIIQLPEGGIYL
jgi:hypothetical protein